MQVYKTLLRPENLDQTYELVTAGLPVLGYAVRAGVNIAHKIHDGVDAINARNNPQS